MGAPIPHASRRLVLLPLRRGLGPPPSLSLEHAARPQPLKIHTRPTSHRPLTTSTAWRKYELKSKGPDDTEANYTKEEQEHFDRLIAQDKLKQIRTPWHHEGSERPPVSRMRSAGAMVKGKLLTTPARLMKLVLPLTTRDYNSDRKDVEPLALLVHPQQPLSYLERLIQSELPMIQKNGNDRVPSINFRAVDPAEHDLPPESQQDLHTDAPFVRWSKSTEVGDFVRDAARGKEFEIEIEGAPSGIRVGVPSFHDRTYYLRSRLRKRARDIASMADVKRECDHAAHRSAQNVAYAGFGSIVAWGGVVAWLTFCTDLGWDVMEPVTYLVGLAGVLIGYLWFLLNRREASYAAAMSLTVSRRQQAQYNKRGFDLNRWHYLLDEASSLRREIMAIANEYDVEWSEKGATHDESVVQALKSRHGRRKPREDEDDDHDGDQDFADEDQDAKDDRQERRPRRS